MCIQGTPILISSRTHDEQALTAGGPISLGRSVVTSLKSLLETSSPCRDWDGNCSVCSFIPAILPNSYLYYSIKHSLPTDSLSVEIAMYIMYIFQEFGGIS